MAVLFIVSTRRVCIISSKVGDYGAGRRFGFCRNSSILLRGGEFQQLA